METTPCVYREIVLIRTTLIFIVSIQKFKSKSLLSIFVEQLENKELSLDHFKNSLLIYIIGKKLSGGKSISGKGPLTSARIL